ncbi:Hypothetical protein D9617_8g050670 [Elsinoe fawcettii]|nr:Hypothetical protein D9617_8g050670 [Elsinoe fawcettii]
MSKSSDASSTRKLDEALTNRFGEMVTMRVGQEQKPICVNKTLLVGASPYFQAAFNGRWAESAAGTIALPDHDPTTFAYMVNWIYTCSLTIIDAPGVEREISTHGLFELYIMADGFEMVGLRNAIVSHFHSEYEKLRGLDTIEYQRLFSILPKRSLLLNLIVDVLASKGKADDIDFRLVRRVPLLAHRILMKYIGVRYKPRLQGVDIYTE